MMIVDDEPLEREVLTMIINKENLRISQLFEATNGLDAVELAKQEQMDVVLMDIKMPIMNGLMAAEIIKEDVPDCRIIFLTAYEEPDFSYQPIKLGAGDYLLKPAHPNEIRQALIKYIPALDHPADRSLPTIASCNHEDIITIMEFIDNNLHLELHLVTLSELVYLNSQYLSRLFKQETGCTITQYITGRRLEKAKHFLSYSQETVMEISEKCGFSDSNYFARVFKKYEGITPTQYQQKSLMGRKKRINSFNNFVM
ncbi:response regulator transcription factor [Peribacillus cavernae]|nr:response regulator [Peribacillus cavernae]